MRGNPGGDLDGADPSQTALVARLAKAIAAALLDELDAEHARALAVELRAVLGVKPACSGPPS